MLNELISHPAFGFFIFFGFAFALFYSLWTLKKRADQLFSDLKQGLNILDTQVDWAQPAKTFSDHFHLIDDKFRHNGLCGSWSAFSKSLIVPRKDIDAPEFRFYQNTQRPGTFFDAPAMTQPLEPPISGNTFVGMGLLLTFIGLIIALSYTRDVFGGDQEDLVTGLTLLLAAAGAKFWASVGGLAASIIQSVYHTWVLNSHEKLRVEMVEKLEKCVVYASSELIAARQLDHSLRQSQQLEPMAQMIATHISAGLDQSMLKIPALLSGELKRSFEPLVLEIAHMAASMANRNHEALIDMAREFSEQVSGASSKAINHVIEQLNLVSQSLEQTTKTLRNTGEQMHGFTESSLKDMQLIMKSMSTDLIETSQRISEDLAQNADRLSGRFDHYFAQIDQHNLELSQVMTQLSGAVLEGTEKITQKMAETLDSSLVDTQTRMQQTVTLLTDQMTGVQHTVLTSLESSTKALTGGLESVTGQVRDALANWSRSAASASSEFGGIHLSLQGFTENLDKAGRLISDNNAAMQVTGERLTEMVSRSTAVMERVNTAINRSTDLQEKFKSLSTVVMGANRDTLEQNTALLRQISNASGLPQAQAESIEMALQSMMEAVKSAGQTQAETFDKYTAQLNRHTQTALNQVSQLVEDLQKRLEVLKARD
jgi:hypothetical protein